MSRLAWQPIVVAILVAACGGGDPPAPPPPAIAPLGLRLPADVTPVGYDLRLELDPDAATFRGRVAIRLRLDAPTDHVWLHAVELTITSAIIVDGLPASLRPLAVGGEEARAFALPSLHPPGEVTLVVDYVGATTHDEAGLFRQPFEGASYLYSQGEAMLARRIVPCLDEPRFKVPWRITVVVPAGDVALGNAPVAAARVLADGRREVRFAPTPPMASYLLALAVGPFELVDLGRLGRGHLPVRVATFRGHAADAGLALARTPPILDALEAYLDRPLPWPKLDLVPVPHFFGGMENPGLITMEADTLLGADDAGQRAGYDDLAAHELAHQWFGVDVTAAWWDDLWLDEAFATWMARKVVRDLGASDDDALDRLRARAAAMAADDEDDATPVRRVVRRSADADAAFDALAYEKGAALLDGFEGWVGPARFRLGVLAYLTAHAGGTATAADFVAALGAAAPPGTAAAFAGALDHPGIPIIELTRRCEPRGATLELTRRGPTAPGGVPVCVRFPIPSGVIGHCVLVDAPEVIPLSDRCPPWIVGNVDALGYYRVAWRDDVARPPVAVLRPAEQLALGDDLAAEVRRGARARASASAMIATLAAAPTIHGQLAATAVARAVDEVVPAAARAGWQATLATAFAPALTVAALLEPGDAATAARRDALLALIPASRLPPAVRAAATARLDRALTALADADPDAVEVALTIAAPAGGPTLFRRVVAALTPPPPGPLRDALLAGLGRFDGDLAPAAVDVFLRDAVAARDAWPVIDGFLARAETRAAGWAALRARLPAVLARFTPDEAGVVLDGVARLCDPVARGEVAAAFAPQVAALYDGPRRLRRALARIDRCVARAAVP